MKIASKSEYERVALFIITIYILSEFNSWNKLIAPVILFIIINVLRKFLPKNSDLEIGN